MSYYNYSYIEMYVSMKTLHLSSLLFINTAKGAMARAVAYTVCKAAMANNLNVYHYLEHILTELPKLADEDGNIDTSKLEHLLPWSYELPAQCHKPRR